MIPRKTSSGSFCCIEYHGSDLGLDLTERLGSGTPCEIALNVIGTELSHAFQFFGGLNTLCQYLYVVHPGKFNGASEEQLFVQVVPNVRYQEPVYLYYLR